MKQYRRYFPEYGSVVQFFIFITVSITSLYNGGLKNGNFVVKIYRCFTVETVKISKATWYIVKLQGNFHFSFGTSAKQSEQPQGDFFARIALVLLFNLYITNVPTVTK
jgi:hypothetical protein